MSQLDWHMVYFLQSMLGGTIAAILAVYCWRRRDVPSARSLMVLAASAAVWLLAYAVEFRMDTLAERMWCVRFEYIGVVGMGPAFFSFALVVSGLRRHLTRRRLVAMSLFPAVLLVLVWTNPWHHLMWSRTWLERSGSVQILAYVRGPMFWAMIAYCYLLLLGGALFVARSYLRARQLHRRQLWAVLIGLAPPWAANALYVMNFDPLSGLDLTPFAFTFSGLVFAWAIFRLRLLKLVPIAREAVLDQMQDAVIILDREERVMDLNPPGMGLSSVKRGRLLGRPVAQVLPELAAAAVRRTPQESRVEFKADGGDRSLIYEVRATPLYDQEESYIGRVLILRDITQRERAARALIRSEAKYRNILESIQEGYYEVDPQGRLLMMNKSMGRLIGRDPDDLLGRDIREFMDRAHARAVTEIVNDVYNTGRSQVAFDWRLNSADGHMRLIESSISPIKDKGGRTTGFRGVCRDVTSRKKAEEERVLREKFQAAIETAGAACHELNQPLQSILILAELLISNSQPDDAMQAKYRQLMAESSRLAEITRRLISITDYRTRQYIGETQILDLSKEAKRS